MKNNKPLYTQFGRFSLERSIFPRLEEFLKWSVGPMREWKYGYLHQQKRQSSDCMAAMKSQTQKGASKTAIVFLLAVIGLFVHVGFRLCPIYYSYFELHNQMSSLIRVADELKDSEIRRRIEEQLKSLKIPADISDVRIERRAQTMLLSLDYVEILTLGFGDYKFDVWKFNFLCKVEDVIPQG